MPWDKFTKGLITPIRSSDYCQTQILISRCKTLSYFHTAPRTWNTEVKRLDIETGLLHEWDEEAAQASVHVHWNAVAKSKLANFGDGIDDTVGKLGGRSHKHACVWWYGASHRTHINLPRLLIDSYISAVLY